MRPNTYTIVDPGVLVCDDCGATGDTAEQVNHFATCKPGESEFWRRYYDDLGEADPEGVVNG